MACITHYFVKDSAVLFVIMSDTASLSAQVNKLNANDSVSHVVSRQQWNSKAKRAQDTETEASELVAVVDDLLNQLTTKFSTMSGELISRSTWEPHEQRHETL